MQFVDAKSYSKDTISLLLCASGEVLPYCGSKDPVESVPILSSSTHLLLLLLVRIAMPGAPSSVLAPSSKARSP